MIKVTIKVVVGLSDTYFHRSSKMYGPGFSALLLVMGVTLVQGKLIVISFFISDRNVTFYSRSLPFGIP